MVTWLNDDERAMWVRLASVVELLPGALETQLKRDSDLSHFEYWVLSMLSEAPDHTLRMTQLAASTSATLSRLSHVVKRLEDRDLVTRFTCEDDRRATRTQLTEAGWHKVVEAAPGHVQAVRDLVIDPLTPRQIAQLEAIADLVLRQINPDAAEAAARVTERVTNHTEHHTEHHTDNHTDNHTQNPNSTPAAR
mgnify:FL=1